MCNFNIFITGLNNWLLIYSLTWHKSYEFLNFKLQQFLGHDLGEKMQHQPGGRIADCGRGFAGGRESGKKN